METERICPSCHKPLPPDVPMGLCPECLIKSGFPTERGGAGPANPGAGAPAGGFVPPPVEEIAKLFPQFEILGFIGKGGMGAVYKARQPALDRFVALKILPPAVGNDPGFAERFNREARALARLSHPNIVVVYDFGKAGDLHYLVMEFVDGANLREVERAGKLSAGQALAIVPQICEALQFAHNEGIVHRDIKPENLLLDKKGRVKITDFGIAKMLGVTEGAASLTGARDVVGTPHYMAPEQIERPQTVDHRADIYSLGVVFYEMLTGELPLGKFAPPSKKVQVDVRLDEVVLHTLEKEPERRYQQASQVKTDVETIATTRQPPVMGAAQLPGTGNRFAGAPAPPPPDGSSDKIILPAFLLAFFFGIFGAHRFYVGKIGTGILQLFTIGGLGIWATIDWILILCKAFTDKEGRRLTRWWHAGPNAPTPQATAQSPGPPKPGDPPKIAAVAPISNVMIIAPAVALLVAGFWKLFWGLAILDRALLGGPGVIYHLPYSRFIKFAFPTMAGVMGMLFYVIPAIVIIFGAVEMMRRRSHAWAIISAIVAMLFCSIIGVPAGIWALVVLLLPGTRAAFANANGRPTTGYWPWILAATGAATLMAAPIILLTPSHRRLPQPFVQMVQQMQPMQPVQPVQPVAPSVPVPAIPPPPAQPPANMGGSAVTIFSAATSGAVGPTFRWQKAGTNGSDTAWQPTNATTVATHLPLFTAAAVGTAPLSYQWSFNSTNVSIEMSNDLNEVVSDVVEAINDIALPMTNVAVALQAASDAMATNITPQLTLQLQSQLEEAQRELFEGANQLQNEIANENQDVAQKQIADALRNAQVQIGNVETNLEIQMKDGVISREAWQQTQDSLAKARAQLQANEDSLRRQSRPVVPAAPGTSPVSPGTVNTIVVSNSSAGSVNTIAIYERADVGDSTDFSRTFNVSPGGQLTLNADRGDIQVGTGPGNKVTVHVVREVTGAGDADAAEILKEEHVTIERNGGNVSITSQDPAALHQHSFWGFNDRNLDAHYEITVPEQYGARLKTGGGNVSVGAVRSAVDIHTAGGNLDCEDTAGSIDANTDGGNIDMRNCAGPLRLHTSGGNMTIDHFSGPGIEATTDGGQVTVDFTVAPRSDCNLHTSGGSMTARLPATATFTLDAHTAGGSVQSDFPVEVQGKFSTDTLRGTVGGGGPALTLNTDGGNIEILKQ